MEINLCLLPIDCWFVMIYVNNLSSLCTENTTAINQQVQHQFETEIQNSFQFWAWNNIRNTTPQFEHQDKFIIDPHYSDYCIWDAGSSKVKKEVKRRVRKSQQLDIYHQLVRIHRQILLNSLRSYFFMRKAPQKDRNHALRRSSRYIGVSMNGHNWQAMINNGFGKKYIGTYATELEAAIAYDFYSFALHDFNHPTNFDYEVETVGQMIESYFGNEKILIPLLFVNSTIS